MPSIKKDRYYIYERDYEYLHECFTLNEVLAFLGIKDTKFNRDQAKLTIDTNKLYAGKRIKNHKINRLYYISGFYNILQEMR